MSKDITHVNPAELAPSWLNDVKIEGLEEIKQYVSPPWLKVVQKQSDDKLLEHHNVGDVILSPTNQHVCNNSEQFAFVPIFFYTEYCTWNPISARGTLPAIRDRSFDSSSTIAEKARNSQLRFEVIDGQECRHVEHLNFIIIIQGTNACAGEPIIMSFARGEHFSGKNLCSLIKMRKASPFYCVFSAGLSIRSTPQGNWWGLDIVNPQESPWIDKTDVEKFKELYEEFKELHASASIRANYVEVEDPSAVPAAKSEF